MYEEQIIKCLKNLGKQVWSLQQLMANLDRDVRNMRVSGNTVVKTLPFGVKDISSVQLVDVGRHFKWSGDCTVAANKNLPIKAVTHTACGKKRHAFFLHRTGKAV